MCEKSENQRPERGVGKRAVSWTAIFKLGTGLRVKLSQPCLIEFSTSTQALQCWQHGLTGLHLSCFHMDLESNSEFHRD